MKLPLGFACVALSVLSLACPFYRSDPWRAKVVEVEGKRVCTIPDVGEKDPGWAKPLCLDKGLVDHDQRAFAVELGQCVEIHNHHPVFVAHRIVPCRGQ